MNIMTNLSMLHDQQNEEHRQKMRIERIRSLIHSSTKDDKYKLEEGSQWNFDFESNKFTYVKADLATMTDRSAIAELYHIMGNALYTKNKDLSNYLIKRKVPTPQNEFARLINSIQTLRAEEQIMQTFPGTYDFLWYKFKKYDNQIAYRAEQALPTHLQYLYQLSRDFRGEGLCQLKGSVEEALEETSDAVTKAIMTEDVVEMLEVIYDEIRPVYEKLIEESEDEDDSQMPQNLKAQCQKPSTEMKHIIQAMQEMSKEEGEGEGKGEGEGEDEGEGSGNGEGEGEKPDFGKDPDEQLDAKEGGGEGQYGMEDPVMSGEIAQGHEEKRLAENDYLSYEVMYREVAPYIPFFKKKLMSIMEDNRYNRQGGSYRSGKLSGKKLWKIATNSDKLFSRKIIRRHKDYKVTLLIDESGSMCSSEKNRHAAKATTLFSEVLNAAGIDFEIRGFNCSDRVYKRYGEKFTWKHRRQIERIIIESHGYNAGGNNDGWAVRKACHYQRVASTRDSEKIILVMTDGMPAESGGVSCVEKDDGKIKGSKSSYSDFPLRYEVAEASKEATVIGIGINARHVEDYYQENVVCSDVSELPLMVLNKLKTNIRRG